MRVVGPCADLRLLYPKHYLPCEVMTLEQAWCDSKLKAWKASVRQLLLSTSLSCELVEDILSTIQSAHHVSS